MIFSHNFFVDEFADVRHGGALDIYLEANQRWQTSSKVIPQYQPSIDMPTRLDLHDIHFMQNNISNNYGDAKYTVVGNARDIRDGKLDPNTLPVVGVWRDTRGKIWTVDHRRLAALILSGKVESVNVRWVEKHEVDRQRYKMSTLSEGNFMYLTAKRKQSIIVEKPGMDDLSVTSMSGKNLPRYKVRHTPPEIKQTQWQKSEEKTTMKLEEIFFSTTLATSNKAIEQAKALRAGADIPVLRIWEDSNGRTWTIDNDSLAALRLAKYNGFVNVRSLSKEEYEAMKIEVDSQTGGRSYVIPQDQGRSALVVHK
ncbi:hypothetical protein AZI86_04770 [Bdellovibrio bacteriovorus]|uniref:Uncharacterized protein n=1 Tax=Bdellovibrio bacteriovorus TaxID=959 RepID=A0A150WPF9_BDEBC|nr:hypothetical protein [Bdellovibrio bacteriovorus]KYG66372.1 hypothetical protein AZI86_04770 [Bdellovibrio bacteriovorus]